MDRTKLTLAGGSVLPVELIALLAHSPSLAFLGATVIGGAAWQFSDDIASIGRRYNIPFINRFPTTSQEETEEFDTEEVATIATSRRPTQLAGEPFGNSSRRTQSVVPTKNKFPATTMSSLIARGFRPSPKRVLLALDENGKGIYGNPEDMYHLANCGPSGNGKTNFERNLMLQLAPFTDTYYVSPTYAPVKADDARTDFRALAMYLKGVYGAGGDYATIKAFLTWCVQEMESRKRQEVRSLGEVNFTPMWIIIDEWPAIYKKCGEKEIAGVLGDLIRGGRQYKIFCVVASQGFQCGTVGLHQDEMDNFRTLALVGGDPQSQRNLFGDVKLDMTHVDGESKGNVILKINGQLRYGRVPYIDNASTYAFYGLNPAEVEAYFIPDDNDSEDYGSGDFGAEVITTPGQERNQAQEEYYAPRRNVTRREKGDVEEWWTIHSEYQEGSVVATREAYDHYQSWCEARGHNSVEKTPFSIQFNQLSDADGYTKTSKGQKQSPARKHLKLDDVYVEVEEHVS